MSILILLAVLGIAVLVVGYGTQKFTDFVRGDGATERRATLTPPRSHHLDEFDPRSRTA